MAKSLCICVSYVYWPIIIYSPKRETIDIVHAIYEIFYLHVHWAIRPKSEGSAKRPNLEVLRL